MDKVDKILIVDDEPANIFLLELLLEDKYNILKADNGKDAVELTAKELPDLILLDIMMPKIDGLEVCKRLANNHLTRDIPIILVSAKIQDEDVEKGLDLGAVDYIKKPISEIEIKARVRNSLRLKHREDELKRLNKLKTEFLQIVSHDLLSPFTGILSSTNMLLKRDFGKPLNDIQRELIEIIDNSAQKQIRYVKDLLILALQETDKFLVEKEECCIKKVIDEVMDVHKFPAQNKNIALINNVSSGIRLKVDESKVFQIFSNLIGNAIKFTCKDGKIEVFFDEKKDNYFLAVRDSGLGMREGKIKELLGECKVYSTPGTENEPGSGLGIKICKKIMEAHNGKILIESRVGGGSTFTLAFPKNDVLS